MRADRLVSLVLLLRQHGRLSATALARELEVSPRTVLRDIEALSVAGVPVYAERGRHGGFELLPGFGTELTGLSHDEALALLVAGSRRGAQVFGLGSALASAMRKVVDALPDSYRATAAGAARRLLVDPETDLLARRLDTDEIPDSVVAEVRHAVFAGHRLRILYAAVEQPPKWRTVDPVGLVTVRGHGYLLATRSGADRTYRLSRIRAAEELDEPAQRPDRVDLDRAWRQRSAEFRAGGDQVTVLVRLDPSRRAELAGTALAVLAEETGPDARLCLEVTFQDARHAEWALWNLGPDAEAVTPQWLRDSLRERAAAMAGRYDTSEPEPNTGEPMNEQANSGGAPAFGVFAVDADWPQSRQVTGHGHDRISGDRHVYLWFGSPYFDADVEHVTVLSASMGNEEADYALEQAQETYLHSDEAEEGSPISLPVPEPVTVTVDGEAVPFEVWRDTGNRSWVARGRVEGTDVVVSGAGTEPGELRLVRVHDTP